MFNSITAPTSTASRADHARAQAHYDHYSNCFNRETWAVVRLRLEMSADGLYKPLPEFIDTALDLLFAASYEKIGDATEAGARERLTAHLATVLDEDDQRRVNEAVDKHLAAFTPLQTENARLGIQIAEYLTFLDADVWRDQQGRAWSWRLDDEGWYACLELQTDGRYTLAARAPFGCVFVTGEALTLASAWARWHSLYEAFAFPRQVNAAIMNAAFTEVLYCLRDEAATAKDEPLTLRPNVTDAIDRDNAALAVHAAYSDAARRLATLLALL